MNKSKLVIIFIFILLNIPVSLAFNNDCEAEGYKIEQLNEYSNQLIYTVAYDFQEDLNRDKMTKAFKFAFNINYQNPSKEELTLIAKVKTIINRVGQAAANTQFKCPQKKGLGPCIHKRAAAFTPPDKKHIILCPIFHDLSPKQKISTLIHEKLHLFGGKEINYIFETYCFNGINLSPVKRTNNADFYTMFIFYHTLGDSIPKCKEFGH